MTNVERLKEVIVRTEQMASRFADLPEHAFSTGLILEDARLILAELEASAARIAKLEAAALEATPTLEKVLAELCKYVREGPVRSAATNAITALYASPPVTPANTSAERVTETAEVEHVAPAGEGEQVLESTLPITLQCHWCNHKWGCSFAEAYDGCPKCHTRFESIGQPKRIYGTPAPSPQPAGDDVEWPTEPGEWERQFPEGGSLRVMFAWLVYPTEKFAGMVRAVAEWFKDDWICIEDNDCPRNGWRRIAPEGDGEKLRRQLGMAEYEVSMVKEHAARELNALITQAESLTAQLHAAQQQAEAAEAKWVELRAMVCSEINTNSIRKYPAAEREYREFLKAIDSLAPPPPAASSGEVVERPPMMWARSVHGGRPHWWVANEAERDQLYGHVRWHSVTSPLSFWQPSISLKEPNRDASDARALELYDADRSEKEPQ